MAIVEMVQTVVLQLFGRILYTTSRKNFWKRKVREKCDKRFQVPWDEVQLRDN